MALFYTLKQSQLCDALKRKVAKVLKNRPAQVRGEMSTAGEVIKFKPGL